MLLNLSKNKSNLLLKIFLILILAILINLFIFLNNKYSFILLNITVYLLSLYLIYLSSKTLKLINPAYLFAIFYTFYFYIWAFPLYLDLENTPYYKLGDTFVQDKSEELMLILTLAMLFFGIGCLFANFCHNFSAKKEYLSFLKTRWIDDWNKTSSKFALFFLILLSLTLAFLFFYFKNIPILSYREATQASSRSSFFEVMANARIMAQFGAGYLMQGIIILLPLCCLALLAKAYFVQKKIWKISFFILSMITVLMMVSLTSRGHFVLFFILIFMLTQFYFKRIKWGTLIFCLILISTFFIGSSIFVQGYYKNLDSFQKLFSDIKELITYRLGLGVRQIHAVLNIFPSNYSFLYGFSYLRDAYAVMPGAQLGFNGWVYNLIYPSRPEGGCVTIGILGESYINLGWSGVIIALTLMGFILQSLYIHLLRKVRKISSLVFFTIVSTYIAKTSLSGVGSILCEPLISIGAAYLIVKFLNSLDYKKEIIPSKINT